MACASVVIDLSNRKGLGLLASSGDVTDSLDAAAFLSDRARPQSRAPDATRPRMEGAGRAAHPLPEDPAARRATPLVGQPSAAATPSRGQAVGTSDRNLRKDRRR